MDSNGPRGRRRTRGSPERTWLMLEAMFVAAVSILVLMIVSWVVSVILRNASIVDIVWGLGFVLVAWMVRLFVDGNPARQWLIVAMVTIWGLRLAIHLFI